MIERQSAESNNPVNIIHQQLANIDEQDSFNVVGSKDGITHMIDQSSNEEYSVMRMRGEDVRRAHYRSQKAMRHYSTFKLSVIALILCLFITIFNILLAMGLQSLPSDLFLYEHRQLVEDWEALPFVEITIGD